MKDFKAIHEAYLAIDNCLAVLESRESAAKGRRRLQRMREINDQAYFVMLFAQLEERIKDQCERLIARKKGLAKWTSRRLWDAVDVDKLSFKQLLALLAEKGGADFNKVSNYYLDRCKIAHGEVLSSWSVSIPSVVVEFQALAARLKAK